MRRSSFVSDLSCFFFFYISFSLTPQLRCRILPASVSIFCHQQCRGVTDRPIDYVIGSSERAGSLPCSAPFGCILPCWVVLRRRSGVMGRLIERDIGLTVLLAALLYANHPRDSSAAGYSERSRRVAADCDISSPAYETFVISLPLISAARRL